MDKLITLAHDSKAKSYSPYSKFKVGAAVEMSSGKLYSGTNIENSSYGLSICAERVAIFKAVSCGEKTIKKIFISCQDENTPNTSRTPCGACRQVISEFSDKNTIIFVEGIGSFSLEDLLPHPFSM